ncbi:hypothetical protein [Calidifontibacter terrae]
MPEKSPQKRSIGALARMAAAVVAVCLLVGVGWFSYTWLKSEGVQGASSPQQAADNFLAALKAKDPVAFADALEPDETIGFGALVKKARAVSAGHGSTQQGHEFDGVTFQLNDVHSQVLPRSQRVQQVVYTAGSANVEIQRGQLSTLLRALIPSDYTAGNYSVAQFQTSTHFQLALTAVNDGHGWFVSPLYTALDYAAKARNLEPTYADKLPAATVEKTPQSAVTAFLNSVALGTGNRDATLSRIAPAEQAVVRDFAFLLGWSQWNSDAQASVVVSSSKLVDLGGGIKGVEIDAASGTWSGIGHHGSYALSGLEAQASSDEAGNWSGSLLSLMDGRSVTGAQTERLVIATVPSGDGYAVSLVGTLMATASTAADWAIPTLLDQAAAKSR